MEDSIFEQILGYIWTTFYDTIIYLFSVERIFFFLFFGRLQRLREANKVIAWLLCVTVPFYI